jgi:hypothetical protein
MQGVAAGSLRLALGPAEAAAKMREYADKV